MIKKNCLHITHTDPRTDSRVLKEMEVLAKFNFEILAVGIEPRGHSIPLTNVDSKISFKNIKIASRILIFLPKYFRHIINYLELGSKIIFLMVKNKPDVIHCHDLQMLPCAVILKKRFGSKLIYDAHEYETEVKSLKGFRKKLYKKAEYLCLKKVDSIITVSNSIANEYARLYNIAKPHLVLNCPRYEEQKKKNLFRENLSIRADQTVFLYQGGLDKGRGIELLLEAFSGLGSDKNVLVCMGYGPLEQLIQEKARTCNTIYFHPAVSPSVLLNYTSSADYGILFYEDTCLNHRYCSPNKIFEYLMAGLPVLTSNLYEMKRLVETVGVGIVANENTVKGFKQAVTNSLQQDYETIKRNVFEARKKYCWEEQEKVLEEVYSDIK